jgi:dTDP-4-dehydrorhamnose reductase
MIDLLITGAGGALGSVLMRVLEEQHRAGIGVVSRGGPRPSVGKVIAAELTDPNSYRDVLFSLAPKVIVHLAGVTQIAAAYADPERARTVNVQVTVELLRFAQATGARFLFASTDLVFDGEHAPYDEDAATEPLSIYGRTKLEAECYVLTYKRGLVVRLPLMYGFPEAPRAPTFFETLVASLQRGERARLFVDELRSVLWLDDAARALLALADSELSGVVHCGGPERLSRFALGEHVVRALGVSRDLLVPTQLADATFPEPRARDVSLDSSRYRAGIGTEPGRRIGETLPILLARRASPLLS